MLIVIDIDGSIADIELRTSRAGKQPGKKHKAQFQMWLDRLQNNRTLARDKPIVPTVWLINRLSKRRDVKMCYLTGRAEKYRKVTQSWLDRNSCPKAPLYMRPNDNYESAMKYKENVMLKVTEDVSAHNVLIIDDDAEGNCTKMYRKHSWCHLKVMWNV